MFLCVLLFVSAVVVEVTEEQLWWMQMSMAGTRGAEAAAMFATCHSLDLLHFKTSFQIYFQANKLNKAFFQFCLVFFVLVTPRESERERRVARVMGARRRGKQELRKGGWRRGGEGRGGEGKRQQTGDEERAQMLPWSWCFGSSHHFFLPPSHPILCHLVPPSLPLATKDKTPGDGLSNWIKRLRNANHIPRNRPRNLATEGASGTISKGSAVVIHFWN